MDQCEFSTNLNENFLVQPNNKILDYKILKSYKEDQNYIVEVEAVVGNLDNLDSICSNRKVLNIKEFKGNYIINTFGKIDVFVRSHVHYFNHIEFTNTHGCTTPAWKYPDSHLTRGGLAGTVPDVGMVAFTVTPSGYIGFEKYIVGVKYKPKPTVIEI